MVNLHCYLTGTLVQTIQPNPFFTLTFYHACKSSAACLTLPSPVTSVDTLVPRASYSKLCAASVGMSVDGVSKEG